MAKRIFHTTKHHAQYINWGDLPAEESQLWLRDRLSIIQQMVSNCIVHHLSWVLSPSLPLLSTTIIRSSVVVLVVPVVVITFYFFQLLNFFISTHDLYFLSFPDFPSLPITGWQGKGK